MTSTHRNSLCTCGSGLRFKACCGKLSSLPPSNSPLAPTLRERALQKHLAGELFDAVAFYDEAIAQNNCDWDVLHMRATALYQLGLIDEAREAFAALAAGPAHRLPGFRKNYGLVLAACAVQASESSMLEPSERIALDVSVSPKNNVRVDSGLARDVRVAVVMPLYNHAAFVAASIESVMAQTRLPDEMIVIDDGSSDDSFHIAREALARAPFPVQLIKRGNHGAHATLNEAIELATCEWIQPLNSDDRFPTYRIERCIAKISSQPSGRWGYMRVECIDAKSNAVSSRWDERCKEIYRVQDNAANTASQAHALLLGNASISTGNLFFQKKLWQLLRGFADYRYNHDWDFCLRAAKIAEPIVINEPGYLYRVHDRNTIRESAEKAREESHAILTSQFAALAPMASGNESVRDECVEIGYAMDLMEAALLPTMSPSARMAGLVSFPTGQT